MTQAFGSPHSTIDSIVSTGNCVGGWAADQTEREAVQERHERLDELVPYLSEAIAQLQLRADHQRSDDDLQPASFDVGRLIHLLGRFHAVARQLRHRHADRPAIDITDEYDVQDLLHGLLHTLVTDVRPEEWTPSYAGGASRVDFLLKNEQIVVEVKKTRAGLGDKELGEQLIIDIARYRSHPDCKALVCFVYDPDDRLKNPTGLANDLRRMSTNTFRVDFVVSPTR